MVLQGEKKKAYDKKYREEHREQYNQHAKDYYEKNRDKINARKREKITCECGTEVARNSLPRHLTRKSHQKAMELIADTKNKIKSEIAKTGTLTDKTILDIINGIKIEI